MFAAKGSLQAMRDQGFVTFNSIWDESYDNETDDTLRFFKVLDLIKEIASWSDERKLEVSTKIKIIVDFNFKVLQGSSVRLVRDFVNRYGA